MSDDDKLEGKYAYIKPNATIYVINEIQEDSVVEALIDDKNDQPYIKGTVFKVNKSAQEADIFISDLQKNMTVKFELTLPMPNNQLLKKLENLTDYYPDLNYMDIFNVFKMRFQNRKYFTQVGQDLLVNLDPYHNIYNIYIENEDETQRYYSKKNVKKAQGFGGSQKMLNSEKLNGSRIVNQTNKNLPLTQRSNYSFEGDKYFDDFFENNENEIYIFRGEMYSNKYILFEKLLEKLLPEEYIGNFRSDDYEVINTENNNHSHDNINANNNTKNNNSTEGINIDTKLILCYQVFKFLGCTVESTEINENKEGSMEEENNLNGTNMKEEESIRINYKYLMRINIQYDKKKKILGGEFLPILFCEPNLPYILTHVIFYSIFNINRTEKLYHELYLQNLHHMKEHSRKSKKNIFIYNDESKDLIKKEFNINTLTKYLSLLNFSDEEIKTILNVCASIMFLGELNFKNNINSGTIVVENEDIIHIMSDLLKIKEDSIKVALLMNTRDINGEANPKFYKAKECEVNKNLFGMLLYKSLFNWLSIKFNNIIKYEADNNKNNSKNNNRAKDKKRVSASNDTYNKYKDEIKDEEKEEEKDLDDNDIDSKNEPYVSKKKTSVTSYTYLKEKEKDNSYIEEEKSKDDLMADVYDIKNKKVIVENIPHTTSCLISPGFKFQFNEKFGLEAFLCNYINEKIFCLFSTTIYKRKLNEMKEEGLEEYANNIPFSDNTNLIELYEHESFNLLNSINNFCNEHPPSNLNSEIISLYTNLNTKFALNEQIKFGSRDSKDILIYQTEGQAKYDLTQLIFDNYNDVSFEVYKSLLSSSNNIICLIILGLLKEEEILNKKDNLFDEFVMSNGLPRKRTFIINLFKAKLVKIFENIDTFENVQNEEKKKNIINRYKFFLCLKCNNDFYKDVIYPRYLFNQLVYNDLLDVINFYKEQFEQEITYDNFANKIFKMVDENDTKKSTNEENKLNINSLSKIQDDKQRTVKIIETLINFQVPKYFQNFDEIDLTATNYVLGNTKIFLQKNFYNYLLYKMQALREKKRRSIAKIFGYLLGHFYRNKFNKYLRSILGIQQYYWKYREKLKREIYLKKVVSIQSFFRGYKERKKIHNLKKNEIIIAKNFKRYKSAKNFQQIKKSVHILVPKIKKYLNLLTLKEHKDLKDFVYKVVKIAFDKIVLRQQIENSIKINALCRKVLFQINHPKLMAQIKKNIEIKKMIKSALIIQQYYKTYKAFKDFNYKKFAVDLIRGYWRMKRAVQHIDDLYNSILPIQRGIKRYLNLKKSYKIAMKNYMDLKYNNYSTSEIKKTLHYFRVIQREYLQKEGYIKKSKNGMPKVVNLNNDDKLFKKIGGKSYNQKIIFFTEINDIDIYNSSILTYNNEFWSDKFYKLLKVDKKLFGSNSSFLNIKVAETYTCLLNSKGKVYTFGWNDYGQCNIDTVTSEQKSINSLVFSQIECCNKYSFLMNNKGEISQNFNKYEIIFDGFSSDHADSVYAWKDNCYYKLKDNKINKYKININIKKNSVIRKIACGKNFVIFLSDTGLVYSLGKNTKGQLGLQDYKERTVPTINELLIKDGERIMDISCGFKHVIALGSSGKAFSWGSNSNGQCGIDIGGNFNTPMYIDVKNKIKFIAISCGFRASFFMDDQRLLYYCGKSGINNEENYFLQTFKNIIGETETLNMINNINHLNDKNQLENNNSSINANNKKNPKSKRSSSTVYINKSNNSNISIVSCLNKNTFPVKLNCSWNESFSIMYITYADTTNLVNNAYKKELNKKKVKYILDKITLNWITDNVNIRNIMKNNKDILEYL